IATLVILPRQFEADAAVTAGNEYSGHGEDLRRKRAAIRSHAAREIKCVRQPAANSFAARSAKNQGAKNK
ncbi:MAG: hypothetical protein KJN88_08935, partial [Gammaproteobacteria bacterium]|nr:hypothetical protein [Gammaproteobacteria bacterium]